jgi:hypothetical protein
LLNKLTREKFHELSKQIMAVPMRAASHVELLVKEIFEKAISQHHFVDMYADLCVLLHVHFSKNPVGDDARFQFTRLLLNECQASFQNQSTSSKLDAKTKEDAEERTLREFRYKRQVLGNMKLIGALLVRKMLPGKVFIAILAELISDQPTPEASECTAVLLSVAGSAFDREDWANYEALTYVFARLEFIAKSRSCDSRTRCLLLDVLELRVRGWKPGLRAGHEAQGRLKDVPGRRATNGRI